MTNEDILSRCKDFRAALRITVDTSGTHPKEIAYQLGIDPGHFSRMITPSDDPRHFPIEKLNELMDLTGSEAPLIYLAHSRGYGLVKLQSELEKRVLFLEMELQRRDEKLEIITEFVKTIKI